MAYTDNSLNQLIVNKVTSEQYQQMVADGTINENELYVTPVNEKLSDELVAVLSLVYPIGSIYIGTQSTCPMATLISGSTWVLVGANNALWCGNGSNADTTIAAGLPNITGTGRVGGASDSYGSLYNTTGSLYQTTKTYTGKYIQIASNSGTVNEVGFDASRSNSIYGKSTTVQPPSYVVNVWKRTS